MKKNIKTMVTTVCMAAFLIAVSATGVFADTVTYPAEMYVNVSSLNVRTGPGTEYEKLMAAPYGFRVIVTGQSENGWYKISCSDTEAYVCGKYLSAGPVADTSANIYGAVIDPGVKSEFVNTFIRYWDKVPGNVKDFLVSNNAYTYLMPDGTMTDGNAGMTYLHQDSTPAYIMATKNSKVILAAIHESGHQVDTLLGKQYGTNAAGYRSSFMSCNADFQAIYAEEAGNSGYGYWGTSSSIEYFAESWRFYFEDPARVEKNTPGTYEYITGLLSLIQ